MYKEWKKEKAEVINSLKLGYALNDEQYISMMLNWNLNPDETEKVSELYCGCFCLKEDEQRIKDVINGKYVELIERMQNDEFALEAFIYELRCHEYWITNDITDVIYALGMDEQEFYTNERYIELMKKAIEKYNEEENKND